MIAGVIKGWPGTFVVIMSRERQRRTLLLFGALTFYLVLQSGWWAWLLVKKDREMEGLIHAFDLRPDTPGWTDVHSSRTLWMVVGEGSVFVLLMLAALWLVYRSVRHELHLARQQHDFLLAVSHELRTPVAGIKLHLQTLERPELSPAQRGERHQRALDDASRLSDLTDRILLATRLEEGELPLEPAPHDLRALCERAIAHARSTYAQAHTIDLRAVPLHASVDPTAFASVLGNLLENAAKYAPAGSPIEVVLRKEQGKAILHVLDRGPGIAPADRDRLFSKFQRGGEEPTRRTTGTGLGLFIVARLMRAMHGSVHFQERPGGGSIFAATFPLH